jgi:hypothetical protein
MLLEYYVIWVTKTPTFDYHDVSKSIQTVEILQSAFIHISKITYTKIEISLARTAFKTVS